MATILILAPANQPEPRLRGSAQFVAGLTALLIGGGMILGSAVVPDAQTYPVMPPIATAISPADGHNAAWLPPDQTPWPLHYRTPAAEPTHAIHHVQAFMIPDRTRVVMETTQPDCWDVRWDLIEMAAAQRRDWTRHSTCPVHANDLPNSGPR